MNLFKRILLNLFPQPEWNIQINPVTFFVNFISAKQFFSVILRRIVENYKLYLYDINFDWFEVKIGFGDYPTLKLQEIETYFSYISCAEFNWYRFLSPWNLAGVTALVFAYKFVKYFSRDQYLLYLNFILAVYYSIYIFLSRVKVYPKDNLEEAYKFIQDNGIVNADIRHIPGKVQRCNYCNYKDICNQAQGYKQKGLL